MAARIRARTSTGVLLCWQIALLGQSNPARISFEVASIKPAAPLSAEMMRTAGTVINGARADFRGVTLTALIARAFRVKAYQVSGPDWLANARFDISAKLPEGASVDQVPEMLQALLRQRLQLSAHVQDKEMDVYALRVAKEGPKFSPKPVNYDPSSGGNLRPGTMEQFSAGLAGLDRPVVDLTGLSGEFMFDGGAMMQAINGQMVSEMLRKKAQMSGDAAASDPDGGPLFDAIRKLGLTLDARKMATPFLVIDHVEKTPSEN